MLTYGRNAKMTFCVFMSQERHKPFSGMFIFIMGVSPSDFAVVNFLLTSLRKGYYLRQRIRRYRFLKAGTAVLLFYYQLLPEFQCEIDFCMMDGWIRFYQYNANVSLPKRHHWERQLHFESSFGWQWVHAIFSDYSNLFSTVLFYAKMFLSAEERAFTALISMIMISITPQLRTFSPAQQGSDKLAT